MSGSPFSTSMVVPWRSRTSENKNMLYCTFSDNVMNIIDLLIIHLYVRVLSDDNHTCFVGERSGGCHVSLGNSG